MSAYFPGRRFKPLFIGLLTASTAAVIFAHAPVMAQGAQGDASADLRGAFREAARDAKGTDELDPAYVLLGVAESAQKQNLPQIAAEAATAFADLIKRATAKALKIGGAATEDTLDQLVDLRFMARTANLPLPQAALDDAMATLFPQVSAAVQRKIDEAESWDEKLQHAEDLADLQASATQILKDDLARDLGAAFDLKTAQLETLATQAEHADERTRMMEALAESRQSRSDRVADANANNINVVAALMQGQAEKTTDAESRQPSEVDVPEELAAGTRSCIETGFAGKQDPMFVRSMQLNCINSGRLPSERRCSTSNLSFLCYDSVPGGEKMTYIYRGTPEELYFQRTCNPDKVVSADAVSQSGAAFRTANTALAFTCAPPDAQ